MSNILVTLTTTPTNVPAANGAFAQYSFALFSGTSTTPVATQESPTVPTTAAPLTFKSVVPGTYTVAVQALDANGVSMSSPLVSTSIVVPPTAQFDAPASITVALG